MQLFLRFYYSPRRFFGRDSRGTNLLDALWQLYISNADNTAGWEKRTARAKTRRQRASGERETHRGQPNLFGHAMSGLHTRQAAVTGVESSRERGSSHSSWKGSLLLSTPATAACLMCRPDIVCPSRLGGVMQSAKAAHGRFSLAGSSLLPGLRARRARFPTCGVVRVAGYSVVWDCDPTPIFSLKSTKRSAAAILGRSAPSLLFMVRFGIFCCRQDFLPRFT